MEKGDILISAMVLQSLVVVVAAQDLSISLLPPLLLQTRRLLVGIVVSAILAIVTLAMIECRSKVSQEKLAIIHFPPPNLT